jgi:hypothetical protein
MDELEARIAAIELVLVELIPWLDAGAVEDATASIRAGMEPEISEDERMVRAQALQLLEDGRKRFAGPAVGVAIRRGD